MRKRRMGWRVDSVSTIIPSHSHWPVDGPLRAVIESRAEGVAVPRPTNPLVFTVNCGEPLVPMMRSLPYPVVRFSPALKVRSSSEAIRRSSMYSGMSTWSSSHHQDRALQKSPFWRPKRDSVARRTSAAPTTRRRSSPGLEGQFRNSVVRAIVGAWIVYWIDAPMGLECTFSYLTIPAVRRVRPLAHFAGEGLAVGGEVGAVVEVHAAIGNAYLAAWAYGPGR